MSTLRFYFSVPDFSKNSSHLCVSRVCCWLQVFARDLEQLFGDINALDPTVLVVENPGGQAISGSLQLDDSKMNKLLIKVSRSHTLYILSEWQHFHQFHTT